MASLFDADNHELGTISSTINARNLPETPQMLVLVSSREDHVNRAVPAGEDSHRSLPKAQLIAAVAVLSGATLLSSISNGLLVIGLPRIAKDIGLGKDLLLWYGIQPQRVT